MPRRWNTLTLVKKINIFGSPRTKSIGLFPWVVPGPSMIYMGIDGQLAALASDSLSLVWRTPIEKMRPVAMWDDELLWVAGQNSIGMLDTKTQRLIWTLKTGYARQRWRDVIVVGDEHGFAFVDPTNGKVREQLPAPSPGPYNTSIVCGDVVVFPDPELGDPVRAVSLTQRRVLWERNLLEELRAQHGIDYTLPLLNLTPGFRGDRVIGTRGSATFAFSHEDGSILWKADVTVPYRVPLVVDGRVPILALERFVVIDEGTGYIFADQKHQELWSMSFTKEGSSYGDTVGFISESGHVAVLDMNDASLVWTNRYRVPFNHSAVADGRFLVTGADGKLWVFSGED